MKSCEISLAEHSRGCDVGSDNKADTTTAAVKSWFASITPS